MTKEGIGFRHICDWVMYLHKHHHEIDNDKLSMYLKDFNMEAVWNEFGQLAIEYMGLPSDNLPKPHTYHHSHRTKLLIKQIFISGNFGRYDANGRDYSNAPYIKRKFRSFCFQTKRLCKLFQLFPYYIFNYGLGWFTTGIHAVLRSK